MDDEKMEYDFNIIITTYNREKMLKSLLDDIFKDNKYRVLVTIFDDSSDKPYDLSGYDVKYIRYVKNNGLKKLWRIIGDTFKYCQKIESTYHMYLQDDLRLKDNFFDECVRLFNKIPDDKKVTLGTLMVESQRNQKKWTNILPVEYDGYYKTQWCELVFMCKYKFFEVLDFKMNPIPLKRWKHNPNISSGVGQQISLRTLESGYNMYHVIDSLCTHGTHESQLFGDYRKQEKLIAI